MIEVHHLNNSRSQRILWLLEELKAPYEIINYKRDSETNLAPERLKKIHILGKSPVIRVDGKVIIESAAISTYIIDQYAPSDFSPKQNDDDYYKYLELMHYAEGSAMLPLLLLLYSSSLGKNAEPLMDIIFSELHLPLVHLSEWLVYDQDMWDFLGYHFIKWVVNDKTSKTIRKSGFVWSCICISKYPGQLLTTVSPSPQ